MNKSKIKIEDLLLSGWVENEGSDKLLFPFMKSLIKDELKFVITTIYNNFQFALLHCDTGAMIVVKNPETIEELKIFENMIIGCDRI